MVTDHQPGFVQRTLKGHAAIGLLSGALMYLLILSGTIAVFDDELHRWEQPNAIEVASLDPRAVQRALESSAAAAAAPSPQIVVHLPSAASPRATLSDGAGLRYLDAAGRPAGSVQTPWSDFVMALHFYLNLPEVWGLALVGALGVMLLALTVTGVLALPRIFRDAFRLNPRASRQLAQVDWHNRLGVWTLPFGVAVAFTGAVLGVMTPGAAIMSRLGIAPGEAAVFAPVFGAAPAPRGGAAPLPDAAAALRSMSSLFPHAVPTDVIVREAGTSAEDIEILASVPQRLIVGEYYLFDAKGRLLRPVGLSSGHEGQQFAASMYKLHFGNFAGVAVKIAYFAFGLALTIVSGTGVSIWLMKRRRRGVGVPGAERLWTMTVWGSPLLLALSFCLEPFGASQSAMTAVFWCGLAAALLAAGLFRMDAATLSRGLRIGLAGLLLAIAGGHAAAMDQPRIGILMIDAALALTAIGLLVWTTGLRPRRRVQPERPSRTSEDALSAREPV